MPDRTGTVPGTFSLSDIESAIRFEEAKSFEFLTSKIENNKDNLVEFKRLELGNIPKDLKLTLSSVAAPSGFSKIWQGAMVVSGKPEDVIAWRLA